jgi:hypothetical protein
MQLSGRGRRVIAVRLTSLYQLTSVNRLKDHRRALRAGGHLSVYAPQSSGGRRAAVWPPDLLPATGSAPVAAHRQR